jgi:predicted transcriptional regulator YdeE
MRGTILSVAITLGMMLASGSRADSPDTRPSAGTTIGDVRIQTLKPYSYAFVSTRTTLNKIQQAIADLMPKIDAALDAGKLRVMGPVIFTYHGASADPDKEFTLDIGVIVKDGTTAPDGIQVINVEPTPCATILYAGAASGLGGAYGKLYGEIGRRGLQPSDISREVYYYWESQDSPNNIVGVQAELNPGK